MREIPSSYRLWRQALPFEEISLGAGGLRFAQLEDLEELQVGYSRSREGATFCTGEPGAWQEPWIVIGENTCLGDPLIMDPSTNPIAIFTAMHGAGEWNPELIASSLEGFGVALSIVREMSVGREHPVGLEANPIPPTARKLALSKIAAANPGVGLTFWALQLGSEDG